jgi:hypothetical protein
MYVFKGLFGFVFVGSARPLVGSSEIAILSAFHILVF